MHPTLISAIADELVRERSRSYGNDFSRRGRRPSYLASRRFRLVRRPLAPQRAS